MCAWVRTYWAHHSRCLKSEKLQARCDCCASSAAGRRQPIAKLHARWWSDEGSHKKGGLLSCNGWVDARLVSQFPLGAAHILCNHGWRGAREGCPQEIKVSPPPPTHKFFLRSCCGFFDSAARVGLTAANGHIGVHLSDVRFKWLPAAPLVPDIHMHAWVFVFCGSIMKPPHIPLLGEAPLKKVPPLFGHCLFGVGGQR